MEIGISKGALKTDADYLGIDHLERDKLFTRNLNEFLQHINHSKYLVNIPKESFFSPLLSPIPRNSSLLTNIKTNNGFKKAWTTFGPDQIDVDWSIP